MKSAFLLALVLFSAQAHAVPFNTKAVDDLVAPAVQDKANGPVQLGAIFYEASTGRFWGRASDTNPIELSNKGVETTISEVTRTPGIATVGTPVIVSARLDNAGSAVILAQYLNWIVSATRSATGVVDLNYTGAFATGQVPSCVVTPVDVNPRACGLNSVGNTGAQVRCFNTNTGLGYDVAFNIVCHGVQ